MAKKKESPTLPSSVSPDTTSRKQPKSFKPSAKQTSEETERTSAPPKPLSKKSQRLGSPDTDTKAKPSAAVEKKKTVTSAKESKASAKTASPKKETAAKKEPATKEAIVKKEPAAKKAAKKDEATDEAVVAKKTAVKKTAAAKKAPAQEVAEDKAAPAVKAAAKKVTKAKEAPVTEAPAEEKPKAAAVKAKSTTKVVVAPATRAPKAAAPAAAPKPREVVKPAVDEIEIRQAYDPKNPPVFVQMQKNRLIELRSSLIDSMDGVVKEVLSSRPEGSDGSVGGMHMGDAGSDAYDRDFALSMLSKEQDALHEINEALLRIDHGVYGVCEMSALPINEERLEALPYTRYTREMQEVIEKEQLGGRFKRPVVRSVFGLDEDGEEDDDDDEEGSSSSSGSNSDSSLDFGKD